MSRTVKCTIILMALTIFFLVTEHRFPALASAASPADKITMSVRSSSASQMYSTLEIIDPKLTKALLQAKKEALDEAPFYSDIAVNITHGQLQTYYRLDRAGHFWETSEQSVPRKLVLSTSLNQRLRNYAVALRANHYGKLLSWEQARNIVQRKSIFTLTDLETGLSFKVQRRAGSQHADVQPISKEDSKIMHQIYNGQWSWKRKAILVQSGRNRLAASMNGMPHGGDGIPDNGFSGHFCVHFQESTSHRSTIPDPAHQLMVYKAAGQLDDYFKAASPLLLTLSFVEAMNQQDADMLRQLMERMPHDRQDGFFAQLSSLKFIQIRQSKKQPLQPTIDKDAVTAEFRVPIKMGQTGQADRNTHYSFSFMRDNPQSPWQIIDIVASGKSANHSSLMP
ncbi:hypothetical protein [Cohnella mopanensis]|uniref:hypothetical protein n=1 Tax=Cohnella mopanensis TaxID=2911966 RepID=UPI001EF7BABF|nr:hypothetical protein [Cohnella mopanensis]